MKVSVLTAKNNLSSIIKQVEGKPGAVVTISRRGVPVADLVAHDASREKIKYGLGTGEYPLPANWKINEGDDEIESAFAL